MSTLNLHKSRLERHTCYKDYVWRGVSLRNFFDKFEQKVYIRLTEDETAFVCTVQRGIFHRKPVAFPVTEACSSGLKVWPAGNGGADSKRL